MEVSDFQAYVKNFSEEKGFTGTTKEQRVLYLMSEVGELAEAILSKEKTAIGLEMFDVIWNVTDLANMIGIDLEKAFNEKMNINKDRKWEEK